MIVILALITFLFFIFYFTFSNKRKKIEYKAWNEKEYIFSIDEHKKICLYENIFGIISVVFSILTDILIIIDIFGKVL